MLRRIAEIGNATARFGVELLDFYCTSYDAAQRMPAGPLHDPVAVALVIDPHLGESVRGRIEVELNHAERAGATVLVPEGEPTATVPVTIDVGRFWDLVVGAVAQRD